MKMHIDPGAHELVLEVSEKTGGVIAALAEAQLYEYRYEDNHYVWRPAGDAKLTIQIIPDKDFGEPVPEIQALAKELEESQSRWLAQYQKANKLESELAKLQTKPAAINGDEEAHDG